MHEPQGNVRARRVGLGALRRRLAAQGVTTASIFGVVAGADSSCISDAVLTVTNTANGDDGRP